MTLMLKLVRILAIPKLMLGKKGRTMGAVDTADLEEEGKYEFLVYK